MHKVQSQRDLASCTTFSEPRARAPKVEMQLIDLKFGAHDQLLW